MFEANNINCFGRLSKATLIILLGGDESLLTAEMVLEIDSSGYMRRNLESDPQNPSDVSIVEAYFERYQMNFVSKLHLFTYIHINFNFSLIGLCASPFDTL